MFCLSRRANVVETFSDGKLFLQNFHALSVLVVPAGSGPWQTCQSLASPFLLYREEYATGVAGYAFPTGKG
jgi:hypothetical protein